MNYLVLMYNIVSFDRDGLRICGQNYQKKIGRQNIFPLKNELHYIYVNKLRTRGKTS